MRQFAILKLLLAAFLLYLAWPYIPTGATDVARWFWLGWVGFFVLVVGGNLATLLKITTPTFIQQQDESSRKTLKD